MGIDAEESPGLLGLANVELEEDLAISRVEYFKEKERVKIRSYC